MYICFCIYVFVIFIIYHSISVGIDAECEYTFKSLSSKTPHASSYYFAEEDIASKEAQLQTNMADAFKERKRKICNEEIVQSKEKKKRDNALAEKLKSLKESFGRTSNYLKRDLQKAQEISEKKLNNAVKCNGAKDGPNFQNDKVIINFEKELVELNPKYDLQDNNSDNFVNDAEVDSILNEIESEINKTHFMQTTSLQEVEKKIDNDKFSTISKTTSSNVLPCTHNNAGNKGRKTNKASNNRCNYKFLELMEKNIDLSDEDDIQKQSGFTEAIKSQIEKYLLDSVKTSSSLDLAIKPLHHDKQACDSSTVIYNNDHKNNVGTETASKNCNIEYLNLSKDFDMDKVVFSNDNNLIYSYDNENDVSCNMTTKKATNLDNRHCYNKKYYIEDKNNELLTNIYKVKDSIDALPPVIFSTISKDIQDKDQEKSYKQKIDLLKEYDIDIDTVRDGINERHVIGNSADKNKTIFINRTQDSSSLNRNEDVKKNTVDSGNTVKDTFYTFNKRHDFDNINQLSSNFDAHWSNAVSVPLINNTLTTSVLSKDEVQSVPVNTISPIASPNLKSSLPTTHEIVPVPQIRKDLKFVPTNDMSISLSTNKELAILASDVMSTSPLTVPKPKLQLVPPYDMHLVKSDHYPLVFQSNFYTFPSHKEMLSFKLNKTSTLTIPNSFQVIPQVNNITNKCTKSNMQLYAEDLNNKGAITTKSSIINPVPDNYYDLNADKKLKLTQVISPVNTINECRINNTEYGEHKEYEEEYTFSAEKINIQTKVTDSQKIRIIRRLKVDLDVKKSVTSIESKEESRDNVKQQTFRTASNENDNKCCIAPNEPIFKKKIEKQQRKSTDDISFTYNDSKISQVNQSGVNYIKLQDDSHALQEKVLHNKNNNQSRLLEKKCAKDKSVENILQKYSQIIG